MAPIAIGAICPIRTAANPDYFKRCTVQSCRAGGLKPAATLALRCTGLRMTEESSVWGAARVDNGRRRRWRAHAVACRGRVVRVHAT